MVLNCRINRKVIHVQLIEREQNKDGKSCLHMGEFWHKNTWGVGLAFHLKKSNGFRKCDALMCSLRREWYPRSFWEMLFNGCERGTVCRRTLSLLLKDTNPGVWSRNLFCESHSFFYGFPLSLFLRLNRLVLHCLPVQPQNRSSVRHKIRDLLLHIPDHQMNTCKSSC